MPSALMRNGCAAFAQAYAHALHYKLSAAPCKKIKKILHMRVREY